MSATVGALGIQGWYDPWFYSYSPWWTYSSRFYGPSWGFGWGWGGFMPAIIVRGTIHGMAVLGLGWRPLGWPLGTSPSLLSRLLLDSSRHYSNGRSSYRDNRSYASGRGSGYTEVGGSGSSSLRNSDRLQDL